MAWKKNVLVVANVTASSDELMAALIAKSVLNGANFTLLVPASLPGGAPAAQQALDTALARFVKADMAASGSIGDSDPVVAVTEIWDPKRFDEIVICTLPLGSSKWLHAGLPERIGKLTGAPVTHVVAAAPKQPVLTEPTPQPNPEGPIRGLLSAFGRTLDR